jgi:L-threonylcarbamoyladenylate synthase
MKAEIIYIDKNPADAVLLAKKIYLEGGVFVYPTDTIYGFGANPFNDEAIQRINLIKGREKWKRYILLISSIDDLKRYVELNSEKHFDYLLSIWPNPISVVLKLNNEMKKLFNSETSAFRIPNHRFCSQLLNELKMPLISTSVNRTEEEPLNDVSMITEIFGNEVDAVFYNKKKSFFQASTLINLTGDEPVLIREGKIKFNDLMKKFV